MASEQFVNDPSTTLNGTITSVATSIVVTSSAAFPTTGNFRIRMEAELCLVTAVSGSTWTVTRGIENTSPVSHASGTAVNAYLTAGALTQFSTETLGIGTWATLPATPPQSNSFFEAADSIYDAMAVAGAWQYFGPCYRLYPPPAFATQVNFGANTSVSTAGGSVYFQESAAGGAGSYRLLMKSVPATPYTIHLRYSYASSTNDTTSWFGLYWRESSTGKLIFMGIRANGNFLCYQQSAVTASPTFTSILDTSTVFPALNTSGHISFAVSDDGTNRKGYATADGTNFLQMWSVARTAGFTTAADQVGLGFISQNGAGAMNLISWREF